MEQEEYDVFISYARKDYVDENNNVIPGNVISKVKEALEQEDVNYWIDEKGIFSSQNWPEEIVGYIEKSKVFVFLSTSNANKSEMTSKEIGVALEYHKPIIPVRIDNSPFSKTVMFHIVNLHHVEYYKNPEKGIADLIRSVNHCLRDTKEQRLIDKSKISYWKESLNMLKVALKDLNENQPHMGLSKEKGAIQKQIIESNAYALDKLKEISPYLMQTDKVELMARCRNIEERRSKLRLDKASDFAKISSSDAKKITDLIKEEIELKHEFKKILLDEITTRSDVLKCEDPSYLREVLDMLKVVLKDLNENQPHMGLSQGKSAIQKQIIESNAYALDKLMEISPYLSKENRDELIARRYKDIEDRRGELQMKIAFNPVFSSDVAKNVTDLIKDEIKLINEFKDVLLKEMAKMSNVLRNQNQN